MAHFQKDTAKGQHKRALDRVNAKSEAGERERTQAVSALRSQTHGTTRLAKSGCDVFTLARIAGHSSITITQRYVHPQADAIERAFQQTARAEGLALPQVTEEVFEVWLGTKIGTMEKGRFQDRP